MKKQLLEKYAKLIINVGINPNKGQKLVISCPVDCAEFGRLCLSAAYDAGCGEVIMNWSDDYCGRETYLKADAEVFESFPTWRKQFFDDLAAEGAARLSIYASDPENLKGVDPKRISSYQKASGKALENFRMLQMKNAFPWCVVSVPIDSWAKKVFADKEENEAVEALWNAILKTVRIDEENDPVQLWKEHIALLTERKNKLNSYKFKYLKYKNSLGTDLTVELPEGHYWEAASEKAGTGQIFVPNLPTEEIFTAPKFDGVNGVICASKPLVLDGNVIENIRFVLKDGKITEAYADTAVDVLRNAIAVDEGAAYLGEVALVPYDSPISNTGILFYNTLFDENASCHFAFGDSYPTIEGGNEMSAEELKAAGLNSSMTHEDFMVGTADLSIVGVTGNGTEIEIFKNGNFAF
ncbi:MAG: aminopeptidase [Clostridia bacterium]|nr:aminopeptidase [Clostridia bacterium]